jgi:hypothetical protein
VSLPLLKVHMLGCVAIDGAHLHWTDLGAIPSRYFSPGSSFGDGLTGSAYFFIGEFSAVVPGGACM